MRTLGPINIHEMNENDGRWVQGRDGGGHWLVVDLQWAKPMETTVVKTRRRRSGGRRGGQVEGVGPVG